MKVLHTLHPALEDGTDRGFRNVGKPQSDAGEIPKGIHTRICHFLHQGTSHCHLILHILLLCDPISRTVCMYVIYWVQRTHLEQVLETREDPFTIQLHRALTKVHCNCRSLGFWTCTMSRFQRTAKRFGSSTATVST